MLGVARHRDHHATGRRPGERELSLDEGGAVCRQDRTIVAASTQLARHAALGFVDLPERAR